MKILVVDDDPAILTLCATTLRAQGHEVMTCVAGQLALTAALVNQFDLALCDINLPDVHGLEIVRAVKMSAPDLPVIVMSALDPREWEPKSVAAGADHFLQKPIRLDVLRNEVAMAELARATLSVIVCDADDGFRRHLANVFTRGGCQVRIVDDAVAIPSYKRPDLVILDAGAEGVENVVRWAGKNDVACFVVADRNKPFDDRLLRLGASLVVNKPVEPDALLIQARFLARRR